MSDKDPESDPNANLERWECFQCARVYDATAEDYCPVRAGKPGDERGGGPWLTK